MSQLKKKYQKEQSELLRELASNGRNTAVLEIKVIDTSKIKGHLIYQCVYLHANKLQETHIIARDITEAMDRLEPYIQSGTAGVAINYILSNERFNDVIVKKETQ